MTTNFIKTKTIGLICGMAVLLSGCAKSYITYELQCGNCNNGNGSSSGSNEGTALVTYFASVESRNISVRSMSPMKKGVISSIFAYKSTDGSSEGIPVSNGNYETSSPGVLTGSNGFKMYLPNGMYNFYAVSDNFSTIPPSFSNGKSEPLFNGIDYLWWKSTMQDITSSQVNIPIVYEHVGTQVVIDVTAGAGIQLNRLLFATITPPEPGARMDLSTGTIPPAKTYGKMDKMGINGFTAQYIMLPLQTDMPMSLFLEVQADGESGTRTYTVDVPVPDGMLKSGNSYVFKAVIDGNSVSFPTVSIKDWTEVDEKGNPLYPIQ